jgi:hypothetical protein
MIKEKNNNHIKAMEKEIDKITEQPFCQTRFSGSIVINVGRNFNYRHFKVNSKWFEDAEYYTFIENGNCLEIRKHYLDVPKTAQKYKTGQFMCVSELPIGKFEIDEDESSEDVILVYCHKTP